VVFIPKNRRQALYKELRRHLGEVFRQLAKQRESQIEEGHLLSDHVHMMIGIPPKYSVAQVIGYIKPKSGVCSVSEACASRVNSRAQAVVIVWP
jgi:putative transposase